MMNGLGTFAGDVTVARQRLDNTLHLSLYPIRSRGVHWLVNFERCAEGHESCYSVKGSSELQSVELLYHLSFVNALGPLKLVLIIILLLMREQSACAYSDFPDFPHIIKVVQKISKVFARPLYNLRNFILPVI